MCPPISQIVLWKKATTPSIWTFYKHLLTLWKRNSTHQITQMKLSGSGWGIFFRVHHGKSLSGKVQLCTLWSYFKGELDVRPCMITMNQACVRVSTSIHLCMLPLGNTTYTHNLVCPNVVQSIGNCEINTSLLQTLYKAAMCNINCTI